MEDGGEFVGGGGGDGGVVVDEGGGVVIGVIIGVIIGGDGGSVVMIRPIIEITHEKEMRARFICSITILKAQRPNDSRKVCITTSYTSFICSEMSIDKGELLRV